MKDAGGITVHEEPHCTKSGPAPRKPMSWCCGSQNTPGVVSSSRSAAMTIARSFTIAASETMTPLGAPRDPEVYWR